jgi:hypothetical protein
MSSTRVELVVVVVALAAVVGLAGFAGAACTISSTSNTPFGAPCSVDRACAHGFDCARGACVPSQHVVDAGVAGEGEGEGAAGEGEGGACGDSCDCPVGEGCINSACQSFVFPVCASGSQCGALANGGCGQCDSRTKTCSDATSTPGLLASLTWTPLAENPDLNLVATPLKNGVYCMPVSLSSGCVDVVGNHLSQNCIDGLACDSDECQTLDNQWLPPDWDGDGEPSAGDPLYVESATGSEAEVIGVDAPAAGQYLIAIFYCGSSSTGNGPTEQYTLDVTTHDSTREFTGSLSGDFSSQSLFETAVVHVGADGSTCIGDVRNGAVDHCP